MNALVIYDSNFGNTKKIADTIASELKTEAVSVYDVSPYNLRGIDLLVVGSPINGWRPTRIMEDFLESLTIDQLNNVEAAAFDTRINIFFHGDAANKMSQILEKAGANIIADPQEFYVQSKEGPLLFGELEKAIEWAQVIKAKNRGIKHI